MQRQEESPQEDGVLLHQSPSSATVTPSPRPSSAPAPEGEEGETGGSGERPSSNSDQLPKTVQKTMQNNIIPRRAPPVPPPSSKGGASPSRSPPPPSSPRPAEEVVVMPHSFEVCWGWEVFLIVMKTKKKIIKTKQNNNTGEIRGLLSDGGGETCRSRDCL